MIIDSDMHIFFSIQIKAELSHILGKQNPVKEIAKFTAKLDHKDTCVYKHGQKHKENSKFLF